MIWGMTRTDLEARNLRYLLFAPSWFLDKYHKDMSIVYLC